MTALVSRIVAPFVAALVAWLTGRIGLELGADFTTALLDATVLFVVAVLLAAYGVVHKLIDKHINPLDVADTDRSVL